MNEEELILNNMLLINKCIKDMHLYWKTEDEYQNYYDDGLIGLINGVKTFDESKNTKLVTYLYTCIKNSISRGIRASLYDKRKIHKETLVSLDEHLKDNPTATYKDMLIDPDVNIEEDLEKKYKIAEVIHAINAKLNPSQKRVFCKYYGIEGYKERSAKEIAKEENRSLTAITTSISNSQRKIRRYLNNNKSNINFINKSKKAKVYLTELEYMILNQFK